MKKRLIMNFAIAAGKDVRYLWFALRDWHGGDSEEIFCRLGIWAEKRMKELSVASAAQQPESVLRS